MLIFEIDLRDDNISWAGSILVINGCFNVPTFVVGYHIFREC